MLYGYGKHQNIIVFPRKIENKGGGGGGTDFPRKFNPSPPPPPPLIPYSWWKAESYCLVVISHLFPTADDHEGRHRQPPYLGAAGGVPGAWHAGHGRAIWAPQVPAGAVAGPPPGRADPYVSPAALASSLSPRDAQHREPAQGHHLTAAGIYREYTITHVWSGLPRIYRVRICVIHQV